MHVKTVKSIIFIHLILLFFTLSIAWSRQGENAMAVRSLCTINNFSFLFRSGERNGDEIISLGAINIRRSESTENCKFNQP